MLIILSSSVYAESGYFNPKLFCKYSYNDDGDDNNKIGGLIAFENEFARGFSAGILVGASGGTAKEITLNEEYSDKEADLALVWVDFAIYIKPQYRFEIGEHLLTPYASLAYGPSISIITNKKSVKKIENVFLGTVAAHYASILLGLDYTLPNRLILSFEFGRTLNLRLYTPNIGEAMTGIQLGIGYRF